MTGCELSGFRVEIDEAATGNWYAQAEEWGCDCGDCRNFLKLARERALPAPVLDKPRNRKRGRKQTASVLLFYFFFFFPAKKSFTGEAGAGVPSPMVWA